MASWQPGVSVVSLALFPLPATFLLRSRLLSQSHDAQLISPVHLNSRFNSLFHITLRTYVRRTSFRERDMLRHTLQISPRNSAGETESHYTECNVGVTTNTTPPNTTLPSVGTFLHVLRRHVDNNVDSSKGGKLYWTSLLFIVLLFFHRGNHWNVILDY